MIPSLVGVKFSSKDLVDLIGFANLEAPHRDDKRFNVMYGCDEVKEYLLLTYTLLLKMNIFFC